MRLHLKESGRDDTEEGLIPPPAFVLETGRALIAKFIHSFVHLFGRINPTAPAHAAA